MPGSAAVDQQAHPQHILRPFQQRTQTHPTLRASPFPEVTDLICRLPLPTLFYRLEAAHLGDLMRLWVRPGRANKSVRRIFKGRRERTGHARIACFPCPVALSPGNQIPGRTSRVKKKRELFPGPALASPTSLMSPYSIHVLVQEY